MTDAVKQPLVTTLPIPGTNYSANLTAWLSMTALSEGTFSEGDHGYNVLVGGTLFNSYADHPRVLVTLKDKQGNVTGKSTGAGRYQILEHNFDVYKVQLQLPDFGPLSQDKIAIQMLKETRALPLIEAGRITDALNAARSRWASFPEAGYGQHENLAPRLIQAYNRFGGRGS